MMLSFVTLLAVALTATMATDVKISLPAGWSMKNVEVKPINFLQPRKSTGIAKVGAANPYICKICVEFFDAAIGELLQIILQQGVLGDCAELCGYLPTALEAQVCDLLCDVVGVDAFVMLLQASDPDPIASCETLDQCDFNDQAAANITVFDVLPKSGQMGATFTINLFFKVTNEIATGQLDIAILPPQSSGSQAIGNANLLVQVPPGVYSLSGSVDTSMTSSMMSWGSGQYTVIGQVCEGTCGSIWGHTKLLSQRQSFFVIQ